MTFRETNIFDQVTTWKEFSVSSTNNEQTFGSKVEDNLFGSGFSYKPSNEKAQRNRFIYWRIHGSTLELIETSLDFTLLDNAIRIHFGENLLSNVSFFEKDYGDHPSVVVFAVTPANNTLHRLVFPHPSVLARSSNRLDKDLPSIFYQLTLERFYSKSNKRICKNNAAQVITCVDERIAFIGAANGSLFVEYTSEIGSKAGDGDILYYEEELVEASIIQRLWTGILPKSPFTKSGGQSSDRSILSMGALRVPSTHGVYIFTFCADEKIRVWSLDRKTCIYTKDLVHQAWSDSDEDPRALKQIVKIYPDGDHGNFTLIAYYGFATESQFHVCSGSIQSGTDAAVIEVENINYCSHTGELIDFQAATGLLWGLWQDVNTNYIIRHSPIERSSENSALEVSKWTDVIQDSLHDIIHSVPVTPEVGELLASKIFAPGTFSAKTLLKALQLYKGSYSSQQQNYTESMIHREIVSEISEKITASIYNETPNEEFLPPDDVARISYTQWSAFFSWVTKCWDDENTPVGIFADNSGIISIVKRGAISLLRNTDKIEAMQYLLSSMENPESKFIHIKKQLELSLPLNEEVNEGDLLRLLDCTNFTAKRLGKQALTIFEDDLFYLMEPSEAAYQHITWLVGGVSDMEFIVNSAESSTDNQGLSFTSRFISKFRLVPRPVRTIEALLLLLEKGNLNLLSRDNVHASAHDYCTDLFQSQFMETIVGHSYKQIIQIRFQILRDLTFVLFLLSRLRTQCGLSIDAISQLHSEVIPKTTSLLKIYYSMNWIGNQLESEATTTSQNSDGINLSSLEISGRSQKRAYEPTLPQIYYRSNVHVLQQHLFVHIASLNHYLSNPSQCLNVWDVVHVIIMSFIDKLNKVHTVTFASFLAKKGQFSHLQEYIRLVDSKSPVLTHLLGECYLNFGQFTKARDAFFTAASGLERGTAEEKRRFLDVSMSSHPLSTEDEQEQDIMVQYYMIIMQLFESHRQSDLVVEFGLAALGRVDISEDEGASKPIIPFLWSSIFKQSLLIGNYDQAYIAMISNTDPQRQLDCLRRLVVVLCENRQSRKLCEFPFVGLVEEVKKILEEKAYFVDITRQPNYSQILYSFHVSRRNYRQAAVIMYEYAKRWEYEAHSKGLITLQKQANSYAACINALKLIDPKYRWIPTKKPEVPGKFAPPSPKRKRDDQDLTFMDMMQQQSAFAATTVPSLNTDSSLPPSLLSVVELEDVEKEYMLTLANIKLLQKNPKLHIQGHVISVADTVTLLAEHGLYETALSLAQLHKQDLKPIFDALTMKCFQYQLMPHTNTPTSMRENNYANGVEEIEGSFSTMLEHYLERYDTRDTCYQYRCHVAEKILSADSRIQLPCWLTKSLQEKNPSALMKVYIKHNLYEEAALLALDVISSANTVVSDASHKVWIPYNVIDLLLAHLRAAVQDTLPITTEQKEKISTLKNLSIEIEEALHGRA